MKKLNRILLVGLCAAFCSGCFVVRVLEGDPDDRRPDPGLSELTIPTNSVLATNAPAIQ